MIGPGEQITGSVDHTERFVKLTEPLRSMLLLRARQLTRNEADAEDLVQETYLRAFRFFDNLCTEGSIRSWMLRIMKSIFINQVRGWKIRQEGLPLDRTRSVEEWEVEGEGRLHELNPRQQILQDELDEEMDEAIEQLPDSSQQILVLAALGGYSYEEIAVFLVCPVGTIRSRLSRAKEFLKHRLRQPALQRYGSFYN